MVTKKNFGISQVQYFCKIIKPQRDRLGGIHGELEIHHILKKKEKQSHMRNNQTLLCCIWDFNAIPKNRRWMSPGHFFCKLKNILKNFARLSIGSRGESRQIIWFSKVNSPHIGICCSSHSSCWYWLRFAHQKSSFPQRKM